MTFSGLYLYIRVAPFSGRWANIKYDVREHFRNNINKPMWVHEYLKDELSSNVGAPIVFDNMLDAYQVVAVANNLQDTYYQFTGQPVITTACLSTVAHEFLTGLSDTFPDARIPKRVIDSLKSGMCYTDVPGAIDRVQPGSAAGGGAARRRRHNNAKKKKPAAARTASSAWHRTARKVTGKDGVSRTVFVNDKGDRAVRRVRKDGSVFYSKVA